MILCWCSSKIPSLCVARALEIVGNSILLEHILAVVHLFHFLNIRGVFYKNSPNTNGNQNGGKMRTWPRFLFKPSDSWIQLCFFPQELQRKI